MHNRKVKIIVNISDFIKTLKLCNYFLKKKVGFLYSLINIRLNIWEKPVFLYIVLNIYFFSIFVFSIYFCFYVNKYKLLKDNNIV